MDLGWIGGGLVSGFGVDWGWIGVDWGGLAFGLAFEILGKYNTLAILESVKTAGSRVPLYY